MFFLLLEVIARTIVLAMARFTPLALITPYEAVQVLSKQLLQKAQILKLMVEDHERRKQENAR